MLVLGSFHELAVDERRAGADERHKVRAVHGAPAVLGGLDQLVGHGQPAARDPVGCQNSAMVPDERFQSGSASELNFRWTPQVHLAQTRCSGVGHPGW